MIRDRGLGLYLAARHLAALVTMLRIVSRDEDAELEETSDGQQVTLIMPSGQLIRVFLTYGEDEETVFYAVQWQGNERRFSYAASQPNVMRCLYDIGWVAEIASRFAHESKGM